MLDRLIDALFWLGRYLERAENTARIIEVNYHASIHEQRNSVTNDPTKEDGPFSLNPWSPTEPESMVQWLVIDKENPSSVPSCLEKGHQNAQISRNKLDGETWESLNRAYMNYGSPDLDILEDDRLNQYTTDVRRSLHEFKGTIQSTMFRGEAWYYLTTGQFIERADNCLRQLEVYMQECNRDSKDTHSRSKNRLFLNSIGATILLQTTNKNLASCPDDIIHFLTQSMQSPRCLLFLLRSIQENLRELETKYFGNESLEVPKLERLITRLKTDNITLNSKKTLNGWINTIMKISDSISEEFRRKKSMNLEDNNRSFQSQQ